MRKSVGSTRKLPRANFLPYPELVEAAPHSGSWAVADSNDHTWLPSNGATDKLGKRLYVPLEPGGEGVTLHELAHVRWSPERFPRVRFPILLLQAVEDARINLGLAWIGRPVTLDRDGLAYVAHLAARDAKRGEIAGTIVRAIASLGTQAEETMRAEVDALPTYAGAIARDWVQQTKLRLTRARGRVGGPVAPFRVARQIARDLARDLTRRGLLGSDLSVAGMGCCQLVAVDGDEVPYFAAPRSRYERMLARARRRDRGDDAGGLPVGRMKLARPPLSVRQPSVLRGGVAPRRAALEGTRISRPDRLVLDRAIFARSGRGGGGTILVDTSGSMSISAAQVEGIVRAAGGAAVVAIYSGRGDEGELRIVARGDWRASSEHFEPFGSGNIVDLPALEWLAKQPEPRCWVSDGGVTGVGDQGCAKLLENCLEVVSRARIQHVEDAAAAIDALS